MRTQTLSACLGGVDLLALLGGPVVGRRGLSSKAARKANEGPLPQQKTRCDSLVPILQGPWDPYRVIITIILNPIYLC